MDRRKFLRALSLMSATTALPAYAFARNSSPAASVVSALSTPLSENTVNNAIDMPWLPKIGVIAVGGAGGEILTRLKGKLPCLAYSIAIDCNPDALHRVTADRKILLSNLAIKAFEIQSAAHFDSDTRLQIANAVSGLDIAFIVAGMGGLVGTSISPLVAEVLMEKQVMTIGAPISPFDLEDVHRRQIALIGTHALGSNINAVFPISNELLNRFSSGEDFLPNRMVQTEAISYTTEQNFQRPSQATTAFERLYKGIITPVTGSGLVKMDIEDIKPFMSNVGYSAIGYGSARGTDAHKNATLQAIAHPLLGKHRLCGTSGILWVSIEGSPGRVKMREISEMLHVIRDFSPEPIICFGAATNERLPDDFQVTILSSGILSETGSDTKVSKSWTANHNVSA